MMQTSAKWDVRMMMLPAAIRRTFVAWLEQLGFGGPNVFEIVDEMLLRLGRTPNEALDDLEKWDAHLSEPRQFWGLIAVIVFFENVAPQLQTLDESLDSHESLFRSDGVDWIGLRAARARADSAREFARSRRQATVRTDGWNDLVVIHLTDGRLLLFADRRHVAGPANNQALQLIALLVRSRGTVPFAEAARLVDEQYTDWQGSFHAYSVIANTANRLLSNASVGWRLSVQTMRAKGAKSPQRLVQILPSSGTRKPGRPRKSPGNH